MNRYWRGLKVMARGIDVVGRVTRKTRRADELIHGKSAERASAKKGTTRSAKKKEVCHGAARAGTAPGSQCVIQIISSRGASP